MTDKEMNFNQQLRERTLQMAVSVYQAMQSTAPPGIAKPIVNQIIRSSSSVAANYRAATRSRSDSEFYAKICIVVEEVDETQFWLDYLIQIGVLSPDDIDDLLSEVGELVRLFSSVKSSMKTKLQRQGQA